MSFSQEYRKYFISLENVFKIAPKIWEKHYDIGMIVPKDLNVQEKRAVICIEKFQVDEAYCIYLQGYFARLMKHLFPKDNIKVEQSKFMCKGSDCNEFIIYSEGQAL